jgi:D-alanine-D-alanine ligase
MTAEAAKPIDVDPDWWKTLFDDVYLLTDARSVCDDQITRQEIDIFTTLIPMKPRERILDLCGGHGRHCMELSRRGFRACTVLDYSRRLLDIGGRNAEEKGFDIRFLQGDARHTTLSTGVFDHVLILGNSLGYLPDPDADFLILKESRRLLKPQGWLLLDVTDGESIQDKIPPRAWHEIGGDTVVCRQREVAGSVISAREMVLSKDKGLIRDKTYRIRLYGAEELVALTRSAGFGDVRVHTDASAMNPGEDVGCMNHRLVVSARKC